MLFTTLSFIAGFIIGPVILLLIANRINVSRRKAPSEPLRPTRDELLDGIAHMRDRMRAIENASSEKVVRTVAQRAQVHAENVMNAGGIVRPEHEMPDPSGIARLRVRIGDYENPDPAYEIVSLMMDTAGKEADYAKALSDWLEEGSTLDLRTLAEPFGKYWDDLDFANAVDTIDSARLHIDDGPLNG